MLAREYLAHLQLKQFGPEGPAKSYDAEVRAHYVESMASAEPAMRDLLEQNLRKRDALESRYRGQLPTPHQSLQDYVRLLNAKETIDVTLRRVGQFQPRENLVLGSIENERVNALSQYWRSSSEHLIVFNRGLLVGLLATSNLVVCALTRNPALAGAAADSTEPLDIVDRSILANLAPRFLEILRCVSEGRAPDPRLTVSLYPWPEKEVRWTQLEDAAMEFVFAHEYAHVLLGHTSRGADEEITESHGGWGAEYEADSLALDFLVETWMSKLKEANPLMIAFALQGACLFFNFLSLIERFSAEVMGRTTMLWRPTRSHPYTYLRWLRMIEKARSKTPPQWWRSAVAPQVSTLEQCLTLYYRAAVDPAGARNTAGIEYDLQRTAVEALARYGLVPAHLYIALRCARAVLSSGVALDERMFASCTKQADDELETAGARPLRDYRQPLAAVAFELSELASSHAKTVGTDAAAAMVDHLAQAFLQDAQARYPLPSALGGHGSR